MVKRSAAVQMMLDRIKKDAAYLDGVPKSYMGDDLESGRAQTALLKYVEQLEANQKPDRTMAGVPNGRKGKRRFRCKECKTTDNVTFAPDPFRHDMHGDATKVHMCGTCRVKSAQEL